MVMDRISASRTYLGDAYDNHEPLEYFLKSKPKLWFVHPQTKKELEGLLRILNDKGEEKALWYIKHVYLFHIPCLSSADFQKNIQYHLHFHTLLW